MPDGGDVRTRGDANAVRDPWTLRFTSRTVPVVVADVPRARALPLRLQAAGPRPVLLGLVLALCAVVVRRSFAR